MKVLQRILGDQTTGLLERMLDATALRHEVLSDNIANVNTPGFKRSDVRFEDDLARALAARVTHPRHIPAGALRAEKVAARAVPEQGTTMRNDGNNVDIDVEMAYMAENTLLFQAVSRQLSQRFAMLRTMIVEGRR